jgi:methionyl-tRNA formyltransferase
LVIIRPCCQKTVAATPSSGHWREVLRKPDRPFFVMDAGADSGDIVSQHRVVISDTDNAASFYAKLKDTAAGQLEEIVTGLIGGTLQRQPQNSDEATVLRKRSKKDGEINWAMPAVGVYNLVRALTRPYVGAHCRYKDAEPKVWAAALEAAPDAGAQPGEILNVEGAAITIQCAVGAVILIDHEITNLPAAGDVL